MGSKEILYAGLGFPVVLVGFPTQKVRGEILPDVNFKVLQALVFAALTSKPSRLLGSEVLFIRTYLGLTQSQFARQIGLASHSRVSQWEKKGLLVTGMDYPAELTIRLKMAASLAERMIAKVYKSLAKDHPTAELSPLEVVYKGAA